MLALTAIPIKGITAADQIAQSVREAILRGQLRGGEALPQDELAAQFGASKIPAREALVQLQSEGLVQFTHNKGAVVTTLTAAGVLEIYDMRIALETLALRRAIPNMTKAEFVRAAGLIQIMDDTHDPLAWSRLNWEFHAALYAPCNMPRLLETVRMLHANVTRYHVAFLTTVNYHAEAQRQHRVILASCKAGNADQAAIQLARHMTAASGRIAEHLSSPDREACALKP